MWHRRSADIRHRIAGTLTSRTVLATLAEDGPTRLTALAVGTGVSRPAKTHSVGRPLSRHDEAALGMAMRAALPLIERLTSESAQQPRSLSPSAR
jgi:hypothetical protein